MTGFSSLAADTTWDYTKYPCPQAEVDSAGTLTQKDGEWKEVFVYLHEIYSSRTYLKKACRQTVPSEYP